ncbi:peptide synthetase [Streptomyces roseoverticillatus]|nr:peptide synthetase [Streptomyces roseoverticillatus]
MIVATPLTPREAILCGLLADLFGVPRVTPGDSFVRLGGDSIIAVQLVGAARKAGLRIGVRDVLTQSDVAALAAVARTTTTAGAGPGDGDGAGPLPPTPIMHWLRERGGPADHYHQYVVVRTPAGLTHERALTVIQALLDRHDALRLRRTPPGGALTDHLVIQPVGAVRAGSALTRVSTEGLGPSDSAPLVRREVEAARDRLSLGDGTVLQAVWYDAGPDRPGRLAVVINHMVVDGISWRVLTGDLATAWEAVSAGRPPRLDPVPTSFRRWAGLLAAEASAPRRAAELPHWADTLRPGTLRLADRPLDPGQDLEERAGHHAVTLPAGITGPLLTEVPERLNADVNEILLTGLTLALAEHRHHHTSGGASGVLVDLEGHGREELFEDADVSRTVGWFTSIFPVRLELGRFDARDVRAGGPTVGAALARVKEHLRGIPDKGIGYGLLRHLHPAAGPVLSGAATAEIGFNYLGRFTGDPDRDWHILPEYGARLDSVTPGMPMAHVVEIGAITLDSPDGPVLRADWTWATGAVGEAAVHGLAESWFRMLTALVTRARRPDAGGPTPSDVALSSIGQDEIDDLEAALEAF